MSQNTSIDSEVSRLIRRAELLRMASEVFTEDPDFIVDFVRLVTTGRGAASTSTNGNGSAGKTQSQVVEDYLQGEGNRYRTVRQIANGTGLSVTSVGQVLYRSGKGRFEKQSQKGKKRTKQWRMKIK